MTCRRVGASEGSLMLGRFRVPILGIPLNARSMRFTSLPLAMMASFRFEVSPLLPYDFKGSQATLGGDLRSLVRGSFTDRGELGESNR